MIDEWFMVDNRLKIKWVLIDEIFDDTTWTDWVLIDDLLIIDIWFLMDNDWL